MRALVLYHSRWGHSEELARRIAKGLDCRAVALHKRPDLRLYPLVVLAFPAIALPPPLELWTLLLGGSLRHKGLALAAWVDALAGPHYMEAMASAARLGGATLHPQRLQVRLLPGGTHLGPGDWEAVDAWTAELASRFPEPSWPSH